MKKIRGQKEVKGQKEKHSIVYLLRYYYTTAVRNVTWIDITWFDATYNYYQLFKPLV